MNVDNRYGYGLIFVLYTGLREGEALALQYKHLDLKNRKVRIEQNLVMVTDGLGNKKRRPLIQRSVKTEAGVREIPLCDIALEAISNHIALYYTGNDEDYVFKTRTGTHLTPHKYFKSGESGIQKSKNRRKWNAYFETLVCFLFICKRVGSKVHKQNIGTFQYSNHLRHICSYRL